MFWLWLLWVFPSHVHLGLVCGGNGSSFPGVRQIQQSLSSPCHVEVTLYNDHLWGGWDTPQSDVYLYCSQPASLPGGVLIILDLRNTQVPS